MKASAIISAGLIGISFPAVAEEIELGWGNLPDCTRMTCSGKGLICPDTLERGEQRLRLLLSYSSPTPQSVEKLVKSCGERGVAAATLSALLTGFSAAAPAFWTAFSDCLGNRYAEIANLELKTESSCLWPGTQQADTWPGKDLNCPKPVPGDPPCVR